MNAKRFVLTVLWVAIISPAALAKVYEITLEYRPAQRVDMVYLTGDFANWNPTAYPMTFLSAENIWRITKEFEEGRFLYKFVVDGVCWRHDPDNPLREDDGFGGYNSILEVGAAFWVVFDETIGDDFIREEGLRFIITDTRYFNPYRNNRIRIALRTAANDVERVKLLIAGAEKESYDLFRFIEGPRFDYFVGWITTLEEDVNFIFSLKDGDTVRYYGGEGLKDRGAEAERFVSKDTFTAIFRTPEWAKHVVWYQIMIDRFRNANPENDPLLHTLPFTWDWFRETEREKQYGFYHVIWDRMFGGDLTGVREKLGYLQSLGITGIYFNPVFYSPSHHKYNASCFIHIDDRFYQRGDIAEIEGTVLEDPDTWQWTPTDKYFLSFIQEAHHHGIRVIIDGVWNHSGEGFAPFIDLKERGKESPYKDWFVVTCWEEFEQYAHLGRGYEGWAGFGGLPVFAEDEYGLVPPVRDFIFNVTRRWQAPGVGNFPGVDGWRLDVPMDVAGPFWVDWRKLVKELNPDALLVGEVWDDASRWLEGNKFDAVMNYQLAKILVDYFIDQETRISTCEFDRRLRELAFRHPQQATFAQYNLTSSHDTDRVASMVRNPDRPFDARNRLQDPCGRYYDISRPTAEDFNILKLIWTFKFTFPGAPAIYYGDEIGMFGPDDPSNRMPMWWADLMPLDNPEFVINTELKEFLQRLIAARNTFPSLRTGVFLPVKACDEKDVTVFKRALGEEVIYIVINNSAEVQTIEIETTQNLWNILNPEHEIVKVNRANFREHGPSHSDGALIFINDTHTINCISIGGKPDFISRDEIVEITIGPKSGIYLANMVYQF